MKETLYSAVCLAGGMLLATYILFSFALWNAVPSSWEYASRELFAIINGVWWIVLVVMAAGGGDEE